MYDGGEDILLPVQLAGEAVGFPIELPGKLIAAMPLEVICVHVQNHLIVDFGVLLKFFRFAKFELFINYWNSVDKSARL